MATNKIINKPIANIPLAGNWHPHYDRRSNAVNYLYKAFIFCLWIGSVIIVAACDNSITLPEPFCNTHPCPELAVRMVESINHYTIVVEVKNTGALPTNGTGSVEAVFSGGSLPLRVIGNLPVLPSNGTPMTTVLMVDSTDWHGEFPPDTVDIHVYYSYADESNKANNSEICHWPSIPDGQKNWSCPLSIGSFANVVARVDTGTSASNGTISDAAQLVDSKQELFETASINSVSNAPAPIARKYFGIIEGIENTSAPFLAQFVEGDSDRIGLQLLPGLKISICDSSVSVYGFFDAADVTISGNGFTTGALETNNGAKVTLIGTLSEDGYILDLAMKVDPDNASCSQTLTATAQKLIVPLDLNLRLDDYASQAIVGRDLKYKFSIINNGRVSVQNSIVYATVSASVHLKAPAAVSCKPQGNDQVCQIPITKLDPNQSQSLELVFDTTYIQGTALESSFELIAEGDPSLDIAPAGNTAKISHEVTTASDLSIITTHSPDPVAPGVALTYTLVITNNGPSTAHAVVLSDTVPDLLSFVGATVANVKGTCLPPLGERSIISCNLGTMASGATATVTIVAVPKGEGEIIGFANVVAQEADPDRTNDTVAERTVVSYYYSYMPVVLWAPLANLTLIGMTIAPTTGVSAGSVVTITLTLKNVGEGPTRSEFYVDMYVNPKRPPEKPLDAWNLLCKTTPDDTCPNDLGIAWLVTKIVAPGETITLSSVTSDPYLVPEPDTLVGQVWDRWNKAVVGVRRSVGPAGGCLGRNRRNKRRRQHPGPHLALCRWASSGNSSSS